jgi:hypothetical protein
LALPPSLANLVAKTERKILHDDELIKNVRRANKMIDVAEQAMDGVYIEKATEAAKVAVGMEEPPEPKFHDLAAIPIDENE